jgi:hypothetical protein
MPSMSASAPRPLTPAKSYSLQADAIVRNVRLPEVGIRRLDFVVDQRAPYAQNKRHNILVQSCKVRASDDR